jgi:Txe/YoeB family toxin of Txe-Axe toxin-antitoxin module
MGTVSLLAVLRQKILKRINELIKACQREPFSGIGKPEALAL